MELKLNLNFEFEVSREKKNMILYIKVRGLVIIK